MSYDLREISSLLVNGQTKEFGDFVQARSAWSKEQISNLLLDLIGSCANDWLPTMVKAGADVNFRGSEGETPLSVCVHAWVFPNQEYGRSAKYNALANTIELLTLGANPNSVYLDIFSVTALAISLDAPELALAFLLAGANLDIKEPDNYSSDTLRDIMRKSKLRWPAQLLHILDSRA